MRFGVSLPGPFWVSFGGGHRRRRVHGGADPWWKHRAWWWWCTVGLFVIVGYMLWIELLIVWWLLRAGVWLARSSWAFGSEVVAGWRGAGPAGAHHDGSAADKGAKVLGAQILHDGPDVASSPAQAGAVADDEPAPGAEPEPEHQAS